MGRIMKTNYRKLVAASIVSCKRHLPVNAHGHFSVLGLFATALGVIVLLLAGYLKHKGLSAGIATNFVSSLGWGPNGSHEVFKFGLTLLAVMLMPFILFLITILRHHAADHAFDAIDELTHRSAGSWYIAATGLLLLAWFVDIRTPDLDQALLIVALHCLGAALFFTFSILGAQKLTQAMSLHGVASKAQYWFMKSMVFNAIAMAMSIIPLMLVSYNAGLFDDLFTTGTQFLMAPEYRVDWLKAVVNNYPLVAFFEWATVFSLLGWVGLTAIQVYRFPALSVGDRSAII